jgi:hypothetical protein
MHADLDLLCISVYCTADDLLPERPRNRRRRLTDAEVVTLCVAQVVMGMPSDRRFLRAARRQLGHLFPYLPSQDGLHKRRARLAETIEWLVGVFASRSPGSRDDVVLLDSTRVECGRSVETARRSQLAEVCGYGYSRSHSRWFWGCRLHLACAVDGTILRPPRQTEPQTGPHLAPVRQRIESVFWTCKDLLTLERHGARTPRNLFARVAVRLLALAACIALNHQLGRPSRAIATYTA